jgi:hypothetical protein
MSKVYDGNKTTSGQQIKEWLISKGVSEEKLRKTLFFGVCGGRKIKKKEGLGRGARSGRRR